MSFREDAREILKKYPVEIKEGFLSEIRLDYAGGLNEFNPFMEDKYFSSDKSVIVHSERALNELRYILNHPLYRGNQDELHGTIKAIQKVLSVNQARKPKGRTPNLVRAEKNMLRHLREVFAKYFPRKSIKFKRNTLLKKLGEALIGKTLTDTTDKQLLIK